MAGPTPPGWPPSGAGATSGADNAAYAFAEADSGSFVEPEDFKAWADALPEGSLVRERVEALRAVRPRGA